MDQSVVCNNEGQMHIQQYNIHIPNSISLENHNTVHKVVNKIEAQNILSSAAMQHGARHSICIDRSDSSVWSFGDNSQGQLGHEDVGSCTKPRRVSLPARISSVSCGRDFTICLDHEGGLWSFGNNMYGQLGISPWGSRVTTPQAVKNETPFSKISCGANHTMCLDYSGFLWCFGQGALGKLGIGHNKNVATPTQVDFDNAAMVGCGGDFTALIDTYNNIFCAGYGFSSTFVQIEHNGMKISLLLHAEFPIS